MITQFPSTEMQKHERNLPFTWNDNITQAKHGKILRSQTSLQNIHGENH